MGTVSYLYLRALNETPSHSYGVSLAIRIMHCYLPPDTSEHAQP